MTSAIPAEMGTSAAVATAAAAGGDESPALTFHSVSAVAAQTRVRISPGLEMCLAIWAASSPEREPLSLDAGRLRAAMSPGAGRAMSDLDRKLPGWPLHIMGAVYEYDDPDLEASLAQLSKADPRLVAAQLLLGYTGRRLDWLDASADPIAAAASLLDSARLRQHKHLIARPEATTMEILDLMWTFWQAGFKRVWHAQRPRLENQAAALELQLSLDLGRGISGVSPRAVFDAKLDRLLFISGDDVRTVDCREFDSFQIVPSLWLRRQVVATQAAGRLAVSLGCGPALANELDHGRVPAMLAVLGDARRFEILRLCLQRPRTTSELSSLLGITEGPVSRHLKELERGGLVVGRRRGRHVRYSVVVEMLHLLGQRLQRLPRRVWADLEPLAPEAP